MQDILTLEVPKSASWEQVTALEAELKALTEVEDAGILQPRGIDPAQIQIWLQALSGVLALLGTAIPFVEKIIGMVRHKGIKGAKLKLGECEIEVDDRISPKELEALLTALKAN